MSAFDPDALVSFVNSANFASSLETALSLPAGSVGVQNARVSTAGESLATVNVEAGGNIVVRAGGVLRIGGEDTA